MIKPLVEIFYIIVLTRKRRLLTPTEDIIISLRINLNQKTSIYKILFDEAIGIKFYLYIQEDF